MKRHLQLLAALREATEDPEKGYLVRLRLRRALLALNRGFYNDPQPEAVPRELGEAIRRIEARALRLCQPSEALDVRWKREWGALNEQITELEAKLQGQVAA